MLRPPNSFACRGSLHTRAGTVSDFHAAVLQFAHAIGGRNARVVFAEALAGDRAIGNAAGAGARLMLKGPERAEALRRHMEYLELSGRKDFQELFSEKMLF